MPIGVAQANRNSRNLAKLLCKIRMTIIATAKHSNHLCEIIAINRLISVGVAEVYPTASPSETE